MVTSGDWSGTLGTFAPTKLMALGFSTTSADAWKDLLTFATVVSWSDDLRLYSLRRHRRDCALSRERA
jgi:hypothetical protein